MKYCTHCGKELLNEAVICVNCGCMVKMPVSTAPAGIADDRLLNKLAERVKINGIIWLVIGILQVIAGLLISWFSWWVLIVGVLNIISSVKDLNRSNQIPRDPRGIVSDYESITGPVITLIYNVLFGGLIGVVGSIYYFVGLRGFVMENREQLLMIESTCIAG